MGLRGPAAKPQAIRKLEGDKKHRNRREPKFQLTHLRPPSWLPEFALEEWNRVVPALERINMLTEDAPRPTGSSRLLGSGDHFPPLFRAHFVGSQERNQLAARTGIHLIPFLPGRRFRIAHFVGHADSLGVAEGIDDFPAWLAERPNVGDDHVSNFRIFLVDAEGAPEPRLHLDRAGGEPLDGGTEISVGNEVDAVVADRESDLQPGPDQVTDQPVPAQQLDYLRFHRWAALTFSSLRQDRRVKGTR